jgi:HD-GYP domain-containing protein (c-di-GMP phosphodiesterase class II)
MSPASHRNRGSPADSVYARLVGLGLDAATVGPDGKLTAATPWWHQLAARSEVAELCASTVGDDVIRHLGGEHWVAGLRSGDGQVLLARCAVGTSEAASQVAQTIREMLSDARSQLETGGMVREFSTKLAAAYDETNAVFRIMRMMTSHGDAVEQLSLVCNAVQQAMSFGWVAAAFKADAGVIAQLSGGVIIAGNSRGDGQALRAALTELAGRLKIDGWTQVQLPGPGTVAAVTGGEVIFDPITHDGRVIGLLAAGDKAASDPRVVSSELQFIDACSDFVGVFHENLARFHEQKMMSMGVLKSLVAAIDAKDPYTRGHSERVAALSRLIAVGTGFTEEQAERIHVAGLVHDVGKIGVPDWVLRKPSKLDDAEFEMIRQHPETGYRILKDVPLLADVLPAVLEHHERFDGKGYPYGISGENISLIGRIVGLADSFDAMCSSRAYRAGLSRENALQEIRRCAGAQYDPRLVEIFLKLDLAEYDALLLRQDAQLPAPKMAA